MLVVVGFLFEAYMLIPTIETQVPQAAHQPFDQVQHIKGYD